MRKEKRGMDWKKCSPQKVRVFFFFLMHMSAKRKYFSREQTKNSIKKQYYFCEQNLFDLGLTLKLGHYFCLGKSKL